MFTDQKPKVFKNMFMGLLVLFGASTATNYLNQAIMLSHDYFVADTSMTDETIKAHITDLLYMDSIDWNFSGNELNQLTSNAITFLDPSEHVSKKSDVSSTGKDIFNTYFSIDIDGSVITESIGTRGWFDIFDPPYYYRYKIDFFQICIMLIVNAAIFVVTGYKVFKIISELLVTRISGALIAGDLTSGQKTKKVIENFVSAYLCLFFILVCIKLYNIYQQYINTQSWNGIVRFFMLIFAGLVVLDGPNIIEKLFGMDIGLSNEMFKLLSVGRMGAGAASLAGHLASGLSGSGFGNSSKGGKGAMKTDNPNKDQQGKTKEPQVDPTSKPETGPYSNATEPNGQSHSDNSQSGDNGNTNYHMSSAMGHTGSGGLDSSGSGSKTVSPADVQSDESSKNSSFSQDTMEPNEDFNNATGVSTHEDVSDSDPNLQNDMSQDKSSTNDNLNANSPDTTGSAGINSSSSNKGDVNTNANSEGYGDVSKDRQATGSSEQTNQTSADDMKMGKNIASGFSNKSAGSPNNSSISTSSSSNSTSGSTPLGNELQGESNLTQSGKPGQPNMNTQSGSMNSSTTQEPGTGQSSSVATEMGTLRSDNPSGSHPETGTESTGGNNSNNSGSRAGQGQSTQPEGNVANQKTQNSPSPEQEKFSFLDQKWGVDDVKPNINSSSNLGGNSGSASGSSNGTDLKQSGKENYTHPNPDMSSISSYEAAGDRSPADTIGSDSNSGDANTINAGTKSAAAFGRSTNGEVVQPNANEPGSSKSESPGLESSNPDLNDKTDKNTGKDTTNQSRSGKTNQVTVDSAGSSTSSSLPNTGATTNTLNSMSRNAIQPKEPSITKRNETQKSETQQPSQNNYAAGSQSPADEKPPTKRRGRPRKKPQ